MYPPVGIVGAAGAGKDTVADALVERLDYNRVSFAEPMRRMCAAINPIIGYRSDGRFTPEPLEVRYLDALDQVGYDQAKIVYPELRSFLQRLGTEAGREVLGDDVWVNAAMAAAARSSKPPVFPDCRFENEYRAIRAAGGLIFRVTRPGQAVLEGHVSEGFYNEVPHIDADLVNNGTIDKLHERAAQAVQIAGLTRAAA